MGKKVFKSVTSPLTKLTGGITDSLGLFSNNADALKKQADIAERQLQAQQEAAAAANADLVTQNTANVQAGGTAADAAAKRKKALGAGGPVSSSLGISA